MGNPVSAAAGAAAQQAAREAAERAAREASEKAAKKAAAAAGRGTASRSVKRLLKGGAALGAAIYTLDLYNKKPIRQQQCIAECLPPDWVEYRAGEISQPTYSTTATENGQPRCHSEQDEYGDCDGSCEKRCEELYPRNIGNFLNDAKHHVTDFAQDGMDFVGGFLWDILAGFFKSKLGLFVLVAIALVIMAKMGTFARNTSQSITLKHEQVPNPTPPPSASTFMIQAPPNATPGQQISFETPFGLQIAQVPPGTSPGDIFPVSVQVPTGIPA